METKGRTLLTLELASENTGGSETMTLLEVDEMHKLAVFFVRIRNVDVSQVRS
jgi:hypothetical protein